MKTITISLSVFILLVFFSHPVTAQSNSQKNIFKAGDRVLVSPSSLKDEKYWRPGTVTEVHNFSPKKAYSVSCDPQGSSSSTVVIVNEDWIKSLPAGQDATPKNNEQKTNNSGPLPKQGNTVA